MITRFIQEHFLGGVFALIALSVVLGIFGIYVADFILAIYRLADPLLGFLGAGYGK